MNIVKKLVSGMLGLILAVSLFTTMGSVSKAAGNPVIMTTTMDCSVWSKPNTAEVNRVKKITAGYQVTVYPDVVASTAGDGKTFYKTVKGSYILCKCFGEGTVTPAQPAYNPYTPENICNMLLTFKAVYPEGTYFTDATNSYTWTPESGIYKTGYYNGMIGTGCVAFAMELSDAVFGTAPVTIYDDPAYIRVGDIIRINNNRHSVIVLAIDDNGTITVAEANYGSKVHWGRTFTRSDLNKTFNYGWTRY